MINELNQTLPKLNRQIKGAFELLDEFVLKSMFLLDYNIKPRDILDLISQKDLAGKLNVKQETISRQISGNPTLKTLIDIANALDVEVRDLFVSTKDKSTN